MFSLISRLVGRSIGRQAVGLYKIIRFSVEITCSWIKWGLLCDKYKGWETTSRGLSRV